MNATEVNVFNAVLKSMRDSLISLDKDWRYVFVNDKAVRMMGKSREELIGKTFWELFPDTAGTVIESEIRRSMTNREKTSFEAYYQPFDLWLSINVFPYEDELLVYFTNITRFKRAEESLHSLLKEVSDYKHALDESSIVAITDATGIITHANDNFCKISKYTRGELVGQDHRLINSGYHGKEFFHELWYTISNGNVWRGELKNRARDGSAYWVDTTIVPFLDEAGKPYQYVAIRSDITRRKQAEGELLELNRDLERRVKDRTEELEAFSYSISHDLRAPLRAINSYAKIIEEDYSNTFDNEGNRLLGIVQENARKMGTLIDDLLAFSRLGGKELRKSEVDMMALTEQVCSELVKTVVKKPAIEIRHMLPVKADKTLMGQVLVNLISNAIKYSGKKENPQIVINSERSNHYIIYSVEDNGTGFNMEYASKLFGVFQRLHSEMEFEGTGVGLAIVKRIVYKHGGSVWAESEEGNGAKFYFSLPE